MSDRSKPWPYHHKNRNRGRWNRGPEYAIICAYFRAVWDEMSNRKSIFQIIKERSGHV